MGVGPCGPPRVTHDKTRQGRHDQDDVVAAKTLSDLDKKGDQGNWRARTYPRGYHSSCRQERTKRPSFQKILQHELKTMKRACGSPRENSGEADARSQTVAVAELRRRRDSASLLAVPGELRLIPRLPVVNPRCAEDSHDIPISGEGSASFGNLMQNLLAAQIASAFPALGFLSGDRATGPPGNPIRRRAGHSCRAVQQVRAVRDSPSIPAATTARQHEVFAARGSICCLRTCRD